MRKGQNVRLLSNRTILQNVQVCLLKHGIIELTFLGITISILQDFNKSFFHITIHIVIIGHNPSVKCVEWSYIFFQGCLSAYGQHAVVVQCVFADAILCLDLQFEACTKLDVGLYVLPHKTTLIEQRFRFVGVIVQGFTQNVLAVECDVVVISGTIGIE